MKLIPVLSFVVVCGLFAGMAHSQSTTKDKKFYDDAQRGWYWFETQQDTIYDENGNPVTPPPPAKPFEQQMMPKSAHSEPMSAEWFRENLPKMLDTAIDYPTTENVRNYYIAQRIAVDKAEVFSEVSQEVHRTTPMLNETQRRPQQDMVVMESIKRANANAEELFTKLASEEGGLFYFYDSTCFFCQQMTPVLNFLRNDKNVDVFLVSLDGLPLPGLDDPQFGRFADMDPELASQFQLDMTPTYYLWRQGEEGMEFSFVGSGALSYESLKLRTIAAASAQGWISKEELDMTKRVKPIRLIEDDKQPINVDTRQVLSDADYLNNLILNIIEKQE